MLPTKDILVCGGRELNLGEDQRRIFQSGANGLMLGNYLTTSGRDHDQDHALLADLGLTIRPPPHRPHPPSVPHRIRAEGTDLAGLSGKDVVGA
jgi:biotin synthase-like enzyme